MKQYKYFWNQCRVHIDQNPIFSFAYCSLVTIISLIIKLLIFAGLSSLGEAWRRKRCVFCAPWGQGLNNKRKCTCMTAIQHTSSLLRELTCSDGMAVSIENTGKKIVIFFLSEKHYLAWYHSLIKVNSRSVWCNIPEKVQNSLFQYQWSIFSCDGVVLLHLHTSTAQVSIPKCEPLASN